MGSCAPSRESALRVQLAPALLSLKLSTAVPTSFQPQVSPWLRNRPPLPSPRRIPIPHLPCPLSPPPPSSPQPHPQPCQSHDWAVFSFFVEHCETHCLYSISRPHQIGAPGRGPSAMRPWS